MTLSLEKERWSLSHAERADGMRARSGRKLVIELVGPAGAGKTTLLRALGASDESIRAGVRVDRRRDLPLVLRHSPEAGGVLLAALGRDVRAGWSAAVHLLRLNVLLSIASRPDHGATRAVILDEGPTFILTRLAAFPDRQIAEAAFESAWERGLRRTSEVLDAIVWLDAPDTVLAQRIREREKAHRIKRASDSELRHFLDHYRATYSHVVDRIAAAGPTRVLRFDTSRRSTDRLLRQLTRVIAGQHD